MRITIDELSCYHSVKVALESHQRLSQEDIQYAVNYISSFYRYSTVKESSQAFGNQQLILFLAYANQCGIGKYCLTFNEELDLAIETRDTVSLRKILLGPKEMFVELYDNPYLSHEDYRFLIRMVSREMFAAALMLRVREQEEEQSTSDILSRCYDEVCIYDSEILGDDRVQSIMSRQERPSEKVYTIDNSHDSQRHQIHCFDTLDLVSTFTEDVPINPNSGKPFGKYSSEIIRRRFSKEIAMYRRYKESRKSTK